MEIREHIPLAPRTTLHLGGPARYFCDCTSVEEIAEATAFARTKNLRFCILAGGSNVIVPDEGIDGLVIRIATKGTTFSEQGNDVIASVQAGEEWDSFVRMCVERGYAGIECLSGIPGTVGATPIQNVGAYGQEVKDVVESVEVLDSDTMVSSVFTNADCRFSYRMSRFKIPDAGKFIVTGVTFRLRRNGRPVIAYPEVARAVEQNVPLDSLTDGRESLEAVRTIVLALRRRKSMVIDPNDPNSRSVGSFFTNPIVSAEEWTEITEDWKKTGDGTAVPSFPFGDKRKIPAAWLIEHSGFRKGQTANGVGISDNHVLALVNRGGTTTALLTLAKEIQHGVKSRFNILLQREPVIAGQRIE